MKKQFAIKLTNKGTSVKTAVAKSESTNFLNFSQPVICCKIYDGLFKQVDKELVYSL